MLQYYLSSFQMRPTTLTFTSQGDQTLFGHPSLSVWPRAAWPSCCGSPRLKTRPMHLSNSDSGQHLLLCMVGHDPFKAKAYVAFRIASVRVSKSLSGTSCIHQCHIIFKLVSGLHIRVCTNSIQQQSKNNDGFLKTHDYTTKVCSLIGHRMPRPNQKNLPS